MSLTQELGKKGRFAKVSENEEGLWGDIGGIRTEKVGFPASGGQTREGSAL